MYDQGKGVTKDYKQTIKWYTLAAEQGHRSSQFNLGNMHRTGQGIIQDYKQAVKWYTLAADQGHRVARHTLGIMYAAGQGVTQDFVVAHMLANISASNGMSSKLRDLIATEMTPSELEQAQQKAREWVEKHGK